PQGEKERPVPLGPGFAPEGTPCLSWGRLLKTPRPAVGRCCPSPWPGGLMSPTPSRYTPTLVVRPAPTSPVREKTVVVLGAFRGGTSLLAQVVHFLGIPLGQRFRHEHLHCYGDKDYVNFEDVEFQDLLNDPRVI